MNYCHHHPAKAGRWFCPGCQRTFCDLCVDAEKEVTRPLCLHCTGALEYRPTQADVVPFWQRLHDFFAFPFQSSPLAILALAVVVSLVGSGGLIFGLLSLLVALVQIKYGFNVIATLTEGRFQAPSLLATLTESGYSIVLKQFAILLFMGAATFGVMAALHPVVGLLLGVFFLLALPMSTIVLAMEESLPMALNPILLVTSMRRIGWPYLLAYLYLLLMFGCSGTFGRLMLEYAGESAAHVIVSASGYYFSLVMYSLMGYMIYQYRQELQLGPVRDDLAVSGSASGENPRIHVLLQQGDYPRVLDLLVNDWKTRPRPLPMLEKYVKVVRFTQDWLHLNKHLTALLQQLLKLDHMQLASALLRDLIKVDPATEIASTKLALDVARALRGHGDSELAARLVKNHHRMTQNAELRVQALELMAELLENDLGQPDVAAKYRALKEKIASTPPDVGGALEYEPVSR